MALIPYEPFEQLNLFRQELERFFANYAGGGMSSSFGVKSLNVYETETEVVAVVHLLGIEKAEDVRISVQDGRVLMLEGKMKSTLEINQKHVSKYQQMSQSFQQAIPLPAFVQPTGFTTTFHGGVLKIQFRKA